MVEHWSFAQTSNKPKPAVEGSKPSAPVCLDYKCPYLRIQATGLLNLYARVRLLLGALNMYEFWLRLTTKEYWIVSKDYWADEHRVFRTEVEAARNAGRHDNLYLMERSKKHGWQVRLWN